MSTVTGTVSGSMKPKVSVLLSKKADPTCSFTTVLFKAMASKHLPTTKKLNSRSQLAKKDPKPRTLFPSKFFFPA